MVQSGTENVQVSKELLERLDKSRLARRGREEQLRIALAVHLFLLEEASVSEAAGLAGETYRSFLDILRELGIPAFRYGTKEYEEDKKAVESLIRDKDAND